MQNVPGEYMSINTLDTMNTYENMFVNNSVDKNNLITGFFVLNCLTVYSYSNIQDK